jgi:hypothetical protein
LAYLIDGLLKSNKIWQLESSGAWWTYCWHYLSVLSMLYAGTGTRTKKRAWIIWSMSWFCR